MRGFEEEGIWKINLKQSNNKKQQQIQFKEKHEINMTSFCEPQKKTPKKGCKCSLHPKSLSPMRMQGIERNTASLLPSHILTLPMLRCTAAEVKHFTLHFNGLLSMRRRGNVISHRPTLRYGSGFIAFPWSRVFPRRPGKDLSQAACGDPSPRAYTSHQFCPSLHWTAQALWLAAALGLSSDWLNRVLH